MRLAINGRFYAAAVTGVQRFAREVTHRLCERVPATVLVPRRTETPALPGSPAIARGRLHGHVWEQLEAPRQARAAGCDLTLHLSGTLPARGGPHVAVLHDVLPLTNPEWFSWRFARWYAAVLRSGAPRAAALITVSEWSKREIVRVLRVDPERVHVVLQGIGPFAAPAEPALTRAVRDRFALPDRFMLALGAGDPRKNVQFLRAVRTSWHERWGAPPPLVIVGEAAARVHGRAERPFADALWLGRVRDDELHGLYTLATVLCFPSLAEGFGRAPFEAAACGTPSITADYASAAETLGDAAVTLPLDAARWAAALRTLFEDGEARAGLLARATQRLENMRWENCAERVLDICRAAAPDRAPPHHATRTPAGSRGATPG